MFHVWDISITADTKEAEPLEQKLELPIGIISRVEIKFPAGCHGMVKIRLLRWTFQLVPLSSGEWITGDDETVPTETYYELLEVPTFLTFKGCSPDTDYNHKITIRINVEPVSSASQQELLYRLDKILGVLGEFE
jgi:hypothetical protein